VGLGKLAISEKPLCINQDIQALIDENNIMHPYYSLHYLSQAVLEFQFKHRGTTVGGVPKKQLSDLPFPIPPFNEQIRIAEKIDEILSRLDAGETYLKNLLGIIGKVKSKKNKETEIFESINQFNRLRLSIRKTAFEGKLVPQDQNDEPASQLLKRIKITAKN